MLFLPKNKFLLMNQSELNDAIKSFDLNLYKLIFKETEKRRQDFVNHFTISHIRKMDIDEYVEGKNKSANIFCYALEHTLGAYGLIKGGSARKFGIYYSREQNNYVITQNWNYGTPEDSFRNLRDALVNLIIAGENDDIDTIRQSLLSPMFKGKILATYFPEKYLSIFSEEHLDYYIHRLDLDDKVKFKTDIIEKRQILVNFRNSNLTMSKWPLHAFSYFLYNKYPGSPKDSEYIGNYFETADFASGNFVSVDDKIDVSGHGKGEYVAQQKSWAKLGERGEYVVMQYEIDKLEQLKIKKEPIQQSLKDDSLGYDILSYAENETPIYIEVKSTNLPSKDFYIYLTANELATALKYGVSYHVYIVFNPNAAKPVILDWGNPFIGKDKVNLIPVHYKMHLKKM